ncbi:MAG: hypothetical protein HQK50_01750 [Oligoflexia bacterium]|nr:hypothetical protein [Oligoflexia bacterium]MBF0364261.1 hypothetical protein [Oligoflexia bacterium]
MNYDIVVLDQEKFRTLLIEKIAKDKEQLIYTSQNITEALALLHDLKPKMILFHIASLETTTDYTILFAHLSSKLVAYGSCQEIKEFQNSLISLPQNLTLMELPLSPVKIEKLCNSLGQA